MPGSFLHDKYAEYLEEHVIIPLAAKRHAVFLQAQPVYGEPVATPFFFGVFDADFCALILQRQQKLLAHGQEESAVLGGQQHVQIQHHSYHAPWPGDLVESKHLLETYLRCVWTKSTTFSDLEHLRCTYHQMQISTDGMYLKLYEKHWDSGYWETESLKFEVLGAMRAGLIPTGGYTAEEAIEAWKSHTTPVQSAHVSAPGKRAAL